MHAAATHALAAAMQSPQSPQSATQDVPRQSGGLARWLAFVIVLAIIGLILGVSGLAYVSVSYAKRYAGLIFPGVSVYGTDLDGLSVDEATSLLAGKLPDPGATPLTLRSGDLRWAGQWSDLGLRFDPAATARLAYQVGREGTPEQQVVSQLQALIVGHVLSPVLLLPDPVFAASVLEEMAPELLVPPVNAGLIIKPDRITTTPARSGRELDVEETVAVLHHAFGFDSEGLSLELLTRLIEPAILNPGPVLAQAEAMLSESFVLTATDSLFDFSGTWSIAPEEIAGWLDTRAVEDEEGARLVLTLDADALRSSVESLNGQLTEDQIAIEVEGTAPVVRAAIEAGEHRATASLIHPSRIYTVQFGDTLMSIAAKHGYPVWRLVQANPELDIDRLQPGQEITIPSIDLLFPLPLIKARRILVDISEQRLYAYEGGRLVHDFVASTGIKSSPTITGTFQVLNKDEEAYASSWDLYMPHFIGVYESAPDFINGIHGLPTLSSGRTLWAGHLGRPVSYGCIVLGLEEAATIYEWAELGTLVEIRQ